MDKTDNWIMLMQLFSLKLLLYCVPFPNEKKGKKKEKLIKKEKRV